MQSDVSKRSRGLLVLALALGLMAAVSVHLYISRTERDIEDKFKLDYLPRIVSARDLKMGTLLTYDDLAIREYPQNWLAEDSYADHAVDDVVGHYLKADVSAGQLVLSSQLSVVDTQPINSKLKSGMRAVSIPIDVADVSGDLIVSGDDVDLFVTFDYQGKRTTSLLLRAVHVLVPPVSVAQVNRRGGDMSSVSGMLTVEVTHEDAQKLIAAKQSGVISAVVRASATTLLERENAVQAPRDLASLLGFEAPSDHYKPPEVIYGDRLNLDPKASPMFTNDMMMRDSVDE